MLETTTDELLKQLKSISITDLTPSLEDVNVTPINVSSFNGLSSSDISAMSVTPIPTLTTAQLSAIGGTQGYTYTTSGTGTNLNWQNPGTNWLNSAVGAVTIPSGKAGRLQLKGEDADIEINGKSMMKLLERIEDRLNLLEPNVELEKDWDDLRKLGERYRKLEKKCKEKAETWKKLKAMPPPTVD